jgi:tetratricopeptide (TPR) repeat protein
MKQLFFNLGHLHKVLLWLFLFCATAGKVTAQTELYFDQGVDYIQRSMHHKADSVFSLILRQEKDPELRSMALRYRGMAREALGRYSLAVSDYNQAITLEAGDIGLYVLRGKAYMLMGEVAEAVKDFQRVIQKDRKGPDGRQALEYLADVSMDEGEFNQAVQYYTQLIQIEPKNGKYYYMRAMARLKGIEARPDYKTNTSNRLAACKDLLKSIQLGYTYAQELQQEYCED